jgi:hypothetical protein
MRPKAECDCGGVKSCKSTTWKFGLWPHASEHHVSKCLPSWRERWTPVRSPSPQSHHRSTLVRKRVSSTPREFLHVLGFMLDSGVRRNGVSEDGAEQETICIRSSTHEAEGRRCMRPKAEFPCSNFQLGLMPGSSRFSYSSFGHMAHKVPNPFLASTPPPPPYRRRTQCLKVGDGGVVQGPSNVVLQLLPRQWVPTAPQALRVQLQSLPSVSYPAHTLVASCFAADPTQHPATAILGLKVQDPCIMLDVLAAECHRYHVDRR